MHFAKRDSTTAATGQPGVSQLPGWFQPQLLCVCTVHWCEHKADLCPFPSLSQTQMSACSTMVAASTFVSTPWGATSASARRGSSSATTSTPASTAPKVPPPQDTSSAGRDRL